MINNKKDKLLDTKNNHSNTSTMINRSDNSNNTGNDNGSLEKFNEKLKNSGKVKKNIIKEEVKSENRYRDKVDVYKPKHVGVSKDNTKKDNKIENEKFLFKEKPKSVEYKEENKSKSKVDVYKSKPVGIGKSNDNIDKKNISINKDNKSNSITKKSTSKYVGIITRRDISGLNEQEKNERLEELEKEILLGLDHKLKREIDNLRELLSEHDDIVGTLNNQELISQNEIKEKIDRLEEIIKKIQFYIEQVELLNNNYRFEDIINLTEFKDQNVISNIIEYRDILESNNDKSKDLSDKYKMLDNFILLYREIYIKEELLKHNYEKANNKLEDTKDRDRNYDKLKDDVTVVEQIDKDCKLIIDKQNEYLKALNNRINKIDSNRILRYRLMGTNNLLLTTLMYMTILNNIRFRNNNVQNFARTVVAGRMLRNMMRNRLRPVESIRYEAEDLSSDLYRYLDDVEMMSMFIDSTLDEIKHMKDIFKEEFEGKVPGYEEIADKLNKVEDSILENRNRLKITQSNINNNIVINDKKMVRVKQLNQNAA